MVKLYLTGLLKDAQIHGETHLLGKVELLVLVVILDEESEGRDSKLPGREVKMSHECDQETASAGQEHCHPEEPEELPVAPELSAE